MADQGSGFREPGRRLQRPTLAGGEIFREEITLGGGGGSGYDPQTPYEAQQRLGASALDAAAEARERVSAELGSSGQVVVEATVLPNYLAASHTPVELFAASSLQVVGTRAARGEYRTASKTEEDQPTKTYFVSGTPENAELFASIVNGTAAVTDKAFDQIRQLHALRLSGPATVVADLREAEFASDGRVLLEAVFHPQLDNEGEPNDEAQAANVESFRQFVSTLDNEARVTSVALEGGLAFLTVAITTSSVSDLARYTQLRTLRPLTSIRELPPGVADTAWDLDEIIDAEISGDERIAIFDAGVPAEIQAIFGDLVRVIDLTRGATPLPTHEQHGGWVVSAALLGPLFRDQTRVASGVPVDAFRVWPPPREVGRDEELHWVLNQIKAVLSEGKHRIAVITLAPKMNADEDLDPHEWTTTIDRIAYEFDVLFCIAAGNTGDLAPSANRLLIPADAINAISVGASTATDGEAVRADYSSVGPGRPGQTSAPTGVQFGGDIAAGKPFGALGPNGTVEDVEGTSLAAPVVARACALLRHSLGDAADANLLRCLAAHCAERVSATRAKQVGSTPAEIGFGRLSDDLVGQLEHRENAVTVIYRDTIVRGQQIALQFPFPDELFESHANRQFRLRWTFSCLPNIEAFNSVDYSAAGFELFYRPHAQTFNLRDPDHPEKAFKINRLMESDRFDYEIGSGMRRSDRPASGGKPGWAPEVEARARDGKWESLIRSDMRPRGQALHRPGIDLHFLTRSRGTLRHEPVGLRFALAVTLIGPTGSDVYASVQRYAPALTPLVTAVPIRVVT